MISFKANTSPIEYALRTLGRELKDTARPNKEIAARLLRWTLRNYNSGGRFVGGWAPLAESTQVQKRRLGFSTKPLAPRTGTLRGGFTTFSNAKIAGVRNPVSYARFHNEGTARLPQRRLLPLKDEGEKIALEVYQKHYSQAREKAAEEAERTARGSRK